MTIEKKLLGTNPVSGEVLPEAVSFDGTNDYLSRSSDMTGNADGKTFTFSCWVYCTVESFLYEIPSTSNYNAKFRVSNTQVQAQNSSGTGILGSNGYALPFNTWSHLLISVDLSDTSKRHVYINDVDSGVTWNTFTNDNIDFTDAVHWISARKLTGSTAGVRGPDRKANIFLDYTYRDLSIEANRRLFIDADGKPSKTIPSSPILYLPMTDAATAGSNSGTGGDFTVNGVLATAERGPNQDNCSASAFDGSNDYLSSNGISDSTTGTIGVVSCIFTKDTNGDMNVFSSNNGTGNNGVSHQNDIDQLTIKFGTNSTKAVQINIPNIKINTQYHITAYVDTSVAQWDGSTDIRYLGRKVCINGVLQADNAVTWQTWNKDWVITTNDASNLDIGRYNASYNYWNGDIGEFYFNTPSTYIDLSADNPFWDSDTNRPNSVRKVIEDTGVTPLIALPMLGNDAGNNLGSGGDFTVNSGPYTGARGGSEFWARSADFNGTNGYLSRGAALTGASDGKQATLVFSFNGSANKYIFDLEDASGTTSTTRFSAWVHYPTNKIVVDAYNGSGTSILDFEFGTTLNFNQTYIVMISVDMTNPSKRHTYINNVSESATYTTYTNDNLKLTQTNLGIGARLDASLPEGYWNGDIGFMYFDGSYIDFSQEANRNKFVDQLGYPIDLGDDGSEPTGSSPLVYMKFDNTAALGTNSGTGGNFTVNGTVTAGSDVTP